MTNLGLITRLYQRDRPGGETAVRAVSEDIQIFYNDIKLEE